MRINGFEQIKAFYSWVFNNPDKVRPTHISLYLFLWNQGNRANWVEWFKCPYDLAMQGACIGNKGTYYRCLDELQSFGLIHYKKGINNHKAPQINLIKLYDIEQLTEQVTVPLSEPQTVPLSELLPVHIYKLITDNKKLVIDKLKVWVDSEIKVDKFNFKNSILSLGVSNEIINDYLAVRKLKKLANTETAFKKLVEEINKTELEPNEVIKICVEKSWGGFNHKWLIEEKEKSFAKKEKAYPKTLAEKFEHLGINFNTDEQPTN